MIIRTAVASGDGDNKRKVQQYLVSQTLEGDRPVIDAFPRVPKATNERLAAGQVAEEREVRGLGP